MTERFVNHGVRILAALALLAVMSSPVRSTRAFHAAPPSKRLPRNFAKLDVRRSGQLPVSARLSVRKAVALQSEIEIDDGLEAEIEDELTVTSPPASVFLDVLPSPSPEPYSGLASLAAAPAARPLRC